MAKLKIEDVVASGVRNTKLDGKTVFCLADLKKNYKVSVQEADVKKADFGTGKLLNAVYLQDVNVSESEEDTDTEN